ncbi:MAG: DctP family TRAP transporter solute-binding subunit [Spirochaetota bacterium]
MKKLTTVLIMIAMAATVAFGQGKVYELKLAHADPTDTATSRKHAQAVVFASLVNSRSGGMINVKVYGGGALGGEREYVEAVKAGTIQSGIASGVIANFFPSAMVTDIPYLFPSAEVAWAVLDGPFGQKLSRMFLDQTGMRNLAFAEVGFRNFTNSIRPIRSPADMKGMKVRVQETPLYINMVKGLGANPTPIAWTETYTALQTKVVDAQENPIPTILMAKLNEVQKYITLDGHVYGVDYFVINEKFFQSLPADLQYIVLDSAQIASSVSRGVSQLISAQGVQKLIDSGNVVYVPTASELEQFRVATQQPVIDWLKTKIDQSLINEALAAVQTVVSEQKATIRK